MKTKTTTKTTTPKTATKAAAATAPADKKLAKAWNGPDTRKSNGLTPRLVKKARPGGLDDARLVAPAAPAAPSPVAQLATQLRAELDAAKTAKAGKTAKAPKAAAEPSKRDAGKSTGKAVCATCGRQNTHGGDCRTVSACKRRAAATKGAK